ncbi:MAG: Hsp20/alpha crystallin family protein [Bacteroidales bacterium]|nr:Hsp20/alpha crystallin family protein [Bacteroidales bacterium]
MLTNYRKCYVPSYRDDFFNDNVSSRYYGQGYASAPAVNIIERQEEFRIEVAAAGLSKDDFRIDLDNEILTISSVEKETQEEQHNYTRREFNYGSFSRSFRLEDSFDTDSISAVHNNGVLTIHLPLKKEAVQHGPKTIDIS